MDKMDTPEREIIDLMQPRSGSPALHDSSPVVQPKPLSNSQRILIVDDIETNRAALKLQLHAQGHVCAEAADGYAAFAKLDQQSFDAMILDIHMAPLDGIETLRRLRGSRKPYSNIPVIALTADNASHINAACMDAGADLFLTKPVQKAELVQALSYLSQIGGARILSR